jgi:hypothetical protein
VRPAPADVTPAPAAPTAVVPRMTARRDSSTMCKQKLCFDSCHVFVTLLKVVGFNNEVRGDFLDNEFKYIRKYRFL